MIGFKMVTFSEGSKLETLGRSKGKSVIGRATGDNGRDHEPEVFSAHGIISRPGKKTRGVVLQIGSLSITIASYAYGVEPPANHGACKLFSTDSDGAEQSSVLLENDGTIVMNEGEDWAVRYSKLESEFNELKGKHNDLVTAFDAHTHGGVTSGSASTSAPAPSGATSSADITGAKVEEILIP